MTTEQRKKMMLAIPTAISKYLLVIGIIAFVSFLCPNEVQFQYDYELNGRWGYEDLQTPFDIPVLKSRAQLEAEKKAVREEFPPYYRYHPKIGKQQWEQFDAAFERQMNNLRQQSNSGNYRDVPRRPKLYLDFARSFIEDIFQQGIVGLEETHRQKGKGFVVNIVRGNVTQPQTIQNLTTLSQVQEGINDSLMGSNLPEAEFLVPLFEEQQIFVPNILYDDTLTQKLLQSELDAISPTTGLIERGTPIVQQGQRIGEDVYQRIRSYEEAYRQGVSMSNPYWVVFGGYLLLTTLIVGSFFLYLRFLQPKVFERFNALIFIFMWLVVYSYLVFLVEGTAVLSAYIIPFCIAPIVIKNFFNERLALFSHIVIVLIASFLSSLGYEFTFLQILAGIVAVLTNTETRYWSRFFISMLLIYLTYALGYLGLTLIQGGNWSDVNLQIYGFLLLNVLFTMLAYPLIPLLEKLFGFISSITLVELADLDRPLLKELSMKAPGTMQHSLQVANLSEVAARRIGADALLVKTAALYHDIGKMKHPEFFIENQTGNGSPHDELDFKQSAEVIISHVTEGVKMARKHRLPTILVDFIKTHHGTTRVEYFYRSFINEYPEEPVSESDFRYPGPKPTTKEQTIVMIADSSEAACKSLKAPTGQDIDELIDKIVAGKIKAGQFDQSELTFEELEMCKEEFKKLLRSIHHVRIEYPEEKNG